MHSTVFLWQKHLTASGREVWHCLASQLSQTIVKLSKVGMLIFDPLWFDRLSLSDGLHSITRTTGVLF